MQKVDSILKAHGLDFTIEKQPLFGFDAKGEQLITPYFGLFNSKSGNCINTCKAGYTVSQNRDIVEMVLQGISTFGDKLTVSKAGSIHDGRRVFMQLEIEGDSKVGDDLIKRYVTIVDSNDGSTSLGIGIGDENMWCENQFFKFYKVSKAKFRHTATIEQKIASIPTLIETALGESLKQIKIYNKFISTPLTKELSEKLIHRVLGYDKLASDKLVTVLANKRSIDAVNTLDKAIKTEIAHSGENLWSLFNGVTRYTTYGMKAPTRENGRIESLIIGKGYERAISGFEMLEQLV